MFYYSAQYDPSRPGIYMYASNAHALEGLKRVDELLRALDDKDTDIDDSTDKDKQ